MQVSYNRLENPSKTLWCNRQAKRDSQKLVNFVVPDKSEKFPGSQRNRSDFSLRGTISVTLPENSYFQQQSFSHGSTILPTSGISEFSRR
jgi:hypothetical protein